MNIGTLDIVFAVIVVVAVIRCVYRGFIAEVLSAAALLLGIACAVLFARPAAVLLENYTGIDSASIVIAFLAVFLVVYILIKIGEGLIHRLFEALKLEKLDRALGFFLGIVEGVLLCAVITFLLYLQPFIELGNLLEESIFARLLLQVLPSRVEIFGAGENVHV
jgi:membrane protein required for colicin V production